MKDRTRWAIEGQNPIAETRRLGFADRRSGPRQTPMGSEGPSVFRAGGIQTLRHGQAQIARPEYPNLSSEVPLTRFPTVSFPKPPKTLSSQPGRSQIRPSRDDFRQRDALPESPPPPRPSKIDRNEPDPDRVTPPRARSLSRGTSRADRSSLRLELTLYR